MSKGPGKWQRLILAGLADREAFYLRKLLGRTCTKAQYNALLRAAQELEATRKINVCRFLWGGVSGQGKTVVHRIGTTFTGEDRLKMDRDKCW
jgi:hypothetical protein